MADVVLWENQPFFFRIFNGLKLP